MTERELKFVAIGYACLTIGVRNTSLSGCTLKNASEENIRRLSRANIDSLDAMIDYNIKNGIKLFRISSDIIPFGSHPVNRLNWQEEFSDSLKAVGKKVNTAGIRVSMHPGQYTVLNSIDASVVERAVSELLYHCEFLDVMGVDKQCKLILHIGGVYKNKEKAADTFVKNYFKLPQKIRDRLVIENDDKNFNISDVLNISRETAIPVVFDNLHNSLNPSQKGISETDWIAACRETWKESDGKQKIHYSQQKKGALPGSHSDTICVGDFINFFNGLPNKDIDIMLEVKDKNLSAMKCLHGAVKDSPAKALEGEWARYKYFVLSRSGQIYYDIRQLLKDKDARVSREFYKKLEEANMLHEDKGSEINAAQHIWGYFKGKHSETERKRYEKLLRDYSYDNGKIAPVKNHLLKCAQKYSEEYLLDSLYFYI